MSDGSTSAPTPPGRVSLLGRGLIWLVRFYQVGMRPLLGNRCRFHPTCSQYFILAVEKHGGIKGSAMGVWRLLKCHPFHPGGVDYP